MIAAAALGCAGVKSPPSQTTGSGGSGSTGAGNSSGTGSGGSAVMPMTCAGPCTDFPSSPILGEGVATDAPGMFGNPSGSGPCVTEPETGTLFPNNWLRPRVRVPGNAGLMKVTIHSSLEANDLVAYSIGETWAMPKDVWMSLASHVVNSPISVSVQLPTGGATTVMFQIAPVGAGGSMVFWSADPKQVGKMGVETSAQSAVVNDSYLVGFTVGDETTAKTLTIDQVQQEVLTNGQQPRTSRCIGCHAGTPDGGYVSFVDAWPWPSAFANVTPSATAHGQALPGYLGCSVAAGTNCPDMGAGTATVVQYPWGGPMTFSPAHWTDPSTAGERIAIMSNQMLDFTNPSASYNYEPGRLMWIDLNSTASTVFSSYLALPTQGAAYGYLERAGDPNPAAGFPDWSRDGSTIVYVSTQCMNTTSGSGNCGTQDGRLAKGPGDIYQIPYANKAGGAATPVPGASSSLMDEYYPALSPDGKMLAFNAIPTGGGAMYSNPLSELYVVPFGGAGATPDRLVANDPVACSGLRSPGMNNHWARWSPDVRSAGGTTYYWLIFSSNQYGLPTQVGTDGSTVQISQLYATAVTVSEVGIVSSYPAIYLWNQGVIDGTPTVRVNTTPAWQDFNIPIVVN